MSLAPGETKRFTCPACGKECEAGNLPIMQSVSDTVLVGRVRHEYGVLHAKPTCESFDTMEPDDFIAWVNDMTLPEAKLARLREERRKDQH